MLNRLYTLGIALLALGALGYMGWQQAQQQQQFQQAQGRVLGELRDVQAHYNQQMAAWYQTLIRGQNTSDFKYYFAQFNEQHRQTQQKFADLQQQARLAGFAVEGIVQARETHADILAPYVDAMRQYSHTTPGAIQLTDRATVEIAELNESVFDPLSQSLVTLSEQTNWQSWMQFAQEAGLVAAMALVLLFVQPGTGRVQQVQSGVNLPAILEQAVQHPLDQPGAVANVLAAAGLNPAELEATVQQVKVQTHEMEMLFETQRYALKHITETAQEIVVSGQFAEDSQPVQALELLQQRGQQAEQVLQNMAAQTLSVSRTVRTLTDVREKFQDFALQMTVESQKDGSEKFQQMAEDAQRISNHTHLSFGAVQRELGGLVMQFKATQHAMHKLLSAGDALLHAGDDWRVALNGQRQLGERLSAQLLTLRKTTQVTDDMYHRAEGTFMKLAA